MSIIEFLQLPDDGSDLHKVGAGAGDDVEFHLLESKRVRGKRLRRLGAYKLIC